MKVADTAIYLSVRSDEFVSKADLKLKLLSIGATIAPEFGTANFVVYHNGSKSTIERSHERKCPVVTPNWVNASYEEKQFVPIEEYLIDQPKPSHKPQAVEPSESVNSVVKECERQRGSETLKQKSLSKAGTEAGASDQRDIDEARKITGSQNETKSSTELQKATPKNDDETAGKLIDGGFTSEPAHEAMLHSSTDKADIVQQREHKMFIFITGAHKESLISIAHQLGATYVEDPLSLLADTASYRSKFSGFQCADFSKSAETKDILFDDELLDDSTISQYDMKSQTSTTGDEGLLTSRSFCVLVDLDAEIAADQQIENRTLKHIFSYLFPGVPTVNPSWLYECLCNKKWVPTAPHLTASYQVHLKRQKKWTERHVKEISGSQPLRIFQGMIFYLLGRYEVPTKNCMAQMIELCGGTVLRKKRTSSRVDDSKEKLAHPRNKRIFAVQADEDLQTDLDPSLYKPVHQSAIFDSIEKCDCTFFINS